MDMASFQLPPWVNRFIPLLVLGLLFVGAYTVAVGYYAYSPETLNVGYAPKQPVPFSHKLHAGELKMDCRYCHNTVEDAAHAAVPPTATCGNCHPGPDSEKIGVHQNSPLLAPVRESLETRDGIEWTKVHDLPDFVYFNHAAHVRSGVGCAECHGRVDKMEVVTQVEPLSMRWCLECHRNPNPRLRPPEEVTNMAWVHPEGVDPATYGAELRKSFAEVHGSEINPNTNCSTCHR